VACLFGVLVSAGDEMSGLKVEYKKIKELIPYCNNSRTHSDEQVLQIASSIKEFGFTNPVLIDGQGGIIAGHGRIMAAQKLKMDEVPTITLSDLSEAQKKAYIIADNKLALNSGWDADMLKIELEQLKELDFDLGLIGFSDDELALLMGGETTEGLVDEDQVPELVDDPVTVLGDVWVLGNHRLMCGDSTSIDAVETLMAGKKADFCFTSPPYNAARGKGHKSDRLAGNGFYGDGYKDDKSSTEYVQFNSDIISALSAVAGENFTCCYNINYNKNSPSEYIDVIHAAKQSIPLVETIVWEKAMAVSLQGDNLTRIFEFVFVLCKGKFKINKNRTECLKNLWKISNIGANHESHKACFPIALVEEGVKNFCPHGGVIVEPFGGSGTTLIAAEKLGCKSNAMELDPRYCDVIIKRWQDFTGKQATLEANGKTYNELLNDNQAKNTH
jgi:DNA modification methylase